MCGRFATGSMSWADYQGWLLGDNAAPPVEDIPQSWNVKPTQRAPVVTLNDEGERELILARWWLVPRFFRKDVKEWKATTFNARIEKAASAPSYRASWKDRRCLVPAIGWYEWTGAKGAKVPWYFSIETNAPGLCLAGLWDRARLADDTVLDSFTILTTAPNEVAAEYHDRMPVVLDPEAFEGWLSCTDDAPATAPVDRLKVHRVEPLTGDRPELVEPIASLF